MYRTGNIKVTMYTGVSGNQKKKMYLDTYDTRYFYFRHINRYLILLKLIIVIRYPTKNCSIFTENIQKN